jgi:hypothetical protein
MTSPYETPLVDLMDNVAMVAMEQFITLYAPEKTEGPDATVQWCNHIAGMSYAMAGAMINTRSKLHSDMITNAQKFAVTASGHALKQECKRSERRRQ